MGISDKVEFNVDALIRLKETQGWGVLEMARILRLDPSYISRIIRKEKGTGKKFLLNFINLCFEKGWDLEDFIKEK